MIQLGKNLLDRYSSALRNNQVPANKHPYYTKWLRYYLDFSHKYGFNKHDEDTAPSTFRLFCRKTKCREFSM